MSGPMKYEFLCLLKYLEAIDINAHVTLIHVLLQGGGTGGIKHHPQESKFWARLDCMRPSVNYLSMSQQ